MSKLPPEELWRKHTLEHFEAFRHSGVLKKLRKEGLAACGRKKRFTGLEWAKSSMRERYLSPRYMEWYHKCETVAQKFGLATYTVVCACLISNYQPDKELFPVESKWPQIRVVTEITDTQFLARLTYEAKRRGLYVIARHGSVEATQLYLNMEQPPMPSSLPPVGDCFYMRIEKPIGYPTQAAKKIVIVASQLEKDILIALGYSIPKRLRISRLVSKADDLKISQNRLPKRGLYEIVANTFDEGSISEDEQRRKTVKTQRHRLRKRLIKPYEASE